jgi:cystathionine beta-synthase
MSNYQLPTGKTPTICINYFNNLLYLKLESHNSGLSIKDRVAFYICENLNKNFNLNGKIIVEYSSGNLAIGLAIASKIYKFKLILIISTATSPDKINFLKKYGAELIMVDESLHSNNKLGFRGFAKIVAQSTKNAIFIDQFHNPLNLLAHQETTGPEILKDVPNLDYVFCSMGTGGTASGIATFVKKKKLKTRVIGVTPDSGIYFTTFHRLKELRGLVNTTIEGVGEDFIPGNLKLELLDNVLEATDDEALNEVEYLITNFGIFVGGSSGLALAATKKYIKERNLTNKNIVVICPDSGNRYLSKFQFVDKKNQDANLMSIIKKHNPEGYYPRLIG